uniref:protein SpAN-like isoform X2 n=1 Tax=Myxine glutinosa TaxID=7769 RepID=UPI00359022B6
MFASVRWTAPNDPNKNSYRYQVTWSQNRYSMNSRTVFGTELNITRLVPRKNYTVTVTSSYNGKYSQPATMAFTTVPCGGQVRAEGWLSSPRYPQYIDSNMDCVWDIEAPLGHVVLLTVVDLHYYYYSSSSRCYGSWLAVGYNQTSQGDITMCRYSDVGRTIISPANTMRVFYHKSSYYRTRRFNVTLSSQAPGKTSTSPPDTTTHAESSSETHLVLPTTAASGTTSTGSKSTAVLLLLSIAAKAFCDSMGLT